MSIKNIEEENEKNKAKLIFLNTDVLKIMNLTPNSDQIRAMHEASKYHGIDFNLTSALNYNKNGGYNGKNNGKNNEKIKYLNV